VVAASGAGVIIVNVASAQGPVRIAQIDTPGNALRVACDGNLVAVADGAAGLAVVDITDPPAARILHQVNLGGVAQAVATGGGLAYVGLDSGQVVSVDMTSGRILQRLNVAAPIQDLTLNRDILYVMVVGHLYALDTTGGELALLGGVDAPGSVGAGGRRLRLSAGGNLAYSTFLSGFNIFDLTNPGQPTLIRRNGTSSFGWIQIVPNGSGLGIACVGPNSTDDGQHDVSSYNLNPGGTNAQFITTFVTPGLATAVAIYNGLAYVADGASGLQVVNYLPFDTKKTPPTIQLSANFPLTPAQAEEGKLVRVTATVSDDVQVRNVEFYLNGTLIGVDGSFPFESRFISPSLGTAPSFKLKARATDTGGNFVWTEEYEVKLVPDATPPRVKNTFPIAGAIVGTADTLIAYLSEPINTSTLGQATFTLVSAGADGLMGSGDDLNVTDGAVSWRSSVNGAILTLPGNLPPGLYQASLRPPVSDLAGNPLLQPFSWQFWILGWEDGDNDGVPDNVEAALGLDPNNADSNGNGILDGDEDSDGDGLRNGWELLFGYDPKSKDTDGNEVPDGQEDPDHDGLTNLREHALHTNPLVADSDGDGWPDESEVTGGSDPLDSNSKPKLWLVGTPPVRVVAPGLPEFQPGELSTVVGQVPVAVVLPGLPSFVLGSLSTMVGQPPLSVVVPGLPTFEPGDLSTVVARPSVGVVLPGPAPSGSVPVGTMVGNPPVQVKILR
jgi:hypothetical protein